MNTSFDIRSAKGITGSSRLLIEIGWQCVSFLVTDNDNGFGALLCYHFSAEADEDAIVKDINEIISSQPLLDHPFQKTDIVYAFSESILVPQQLYSPANNEKMLQLVYGDLKEKTVKNELVYKHNLYNVYELPRVIYETILSKFPIANQSHLYSLMPELFANEENRNVLYCIFGVHHVTVLLLKEGQLQVIRSFDFRSPEDAAYHLLNVCRSFEADVNELVLQLSGMISKDSNLYRELYKYFINIEFQLLSKNLVDIEELKNYPGHYFSHLFSIAACV